jgi:flagellar basal-body rod protein FlgB
MIEALFNQPNYVGAKKMLEATVLRHEAIASNLANLEQPHYQRVDLSPSFQRELGRALGTRDAAQIASLKPQLAVDAQAVAANKDGNSVRLEHELTQLSQNYVQSTLENQLVTGSLLRLRMAITGRSA